MTKARVHFNRTIFLSLGSLCGSPGLNDDSPAPTHAGFQIRFVWSDLLHSGTRNWQAHVQHFLEVWSLLLHSTSHHILLSTEVPLSRDLDEWLQWLRAKNNNWCTANKFLALRYSMTRKHRHIILHLIPSAKKLKKTKSGLSFRFSLRFRLRLSNREVHVMEKLTQICNPTAVKSPNSK